MILGIRKWPVVATLIVLGAVAVMIRLGFWQLDRLDEKEALIAEYQRNTQNAAIVDIVSGQEALVSRTVRIDCDRPTNWNAIAGRNDRDQTGYVHLFSCNLPDQPALFAVIGWSQGPQQPEFSGGVVEGVLARAGDGYKVVSNTPFSGLEPLAAPDPQSLPNNHLAYAGQWFFFALVALVIYVLALRRKQRDDGTVADGD